MKKQKCKKQTAASQGAENYNLNKAADAWGQLTKNPDDKAALDVLGEAITAEIVANDDNPRRREIRQDAAIIALAEMIPGNKELHNAVRKRNRPEVRKQLQISILAAKRFARLRAEGREELECKRRELLEARFAGNALAGENDATLCDASSTHGGPDIAAAHTSEMPPETRLKLAKLALAKALEVGAINDREAGTCFKILEGARVKDLAAFEGNTPAAVSKRLARAAAKVRPIACCLNGKRHRGPWELRDLFTNALRPFLRAR